MYICIIERMSVFSHIEDKCFSTWPGAKICCLFINLCCHDGRYCPAVDQKSGMPTGHVHDYSLETKITHREHILNCSCTKTLTSHFV